MLKNENARIFAFTISSGEFKQNLKHSCFPIYQNFVRNNILLTCKIPSQNNKTLWKY